MYTCYEFESERWYLTCGNTLGMNRLPKPSILMSNSTNGGQAPVPNPDRIPSRGVVMETRLCILASDRGFPAVLGSRESAPDVRSI